MKKRSGAGVVSFIASVVSMTLLMVTPTSAGFTDQATTSMTVKAGTVQYKIASESTGYTGPSYDGGAVFSGNTIFPGSTLSKEMSLTNNGEIAFTYMISDPFYPEPGVSSEALQADIFIDSVLAYSGPVASTMTANHVIEPGQTNKVRIDVRWPPTSKDTDFQSGNFAYRPSVRWTIGKSNIPLKTVSTNSSVVRISGNTGIWYPRNVSIESITHNEAWVNWRSADGFKEYTIEYSKNSDFSDSKSVTVPGYNTERTEYRDYPLSYLDPETTYYVHMQSVGTPVPGSWSPTKTFTTKAYVE